MAWQNNSITNEVKALWHNVLPTSMKRENDGGMTALAGLPIYLDLASVLDVADSIRAHAR